MSHEIRTPMTGVLGMIEMLRSTRGRTNRARNLDALDQSARLLCRVLDDVLDFSRIEAGTMAFEMIDFDLARLIEQTINIYRPLALSKGLKLTVSAQSRPVGAVRGDSLRIQQLLSNLVNNAIKFTGDGHIRIDWATSPSPAGKIRFRCSVADTGIGIDPARIDQIFEPYTQEDSSTTRRFGGTGLGLAICKRLVHGMHGSLSVESHKGEGSTFSFELDLEPAHDTLFPLRQGNGPAARSLKILLAEDNVINQALVKALLVQKGHDVICAADGREAVAAAQKAQFDVILMDMQMPIMDGLAATAQIRQRCGINSLTPIIALTADAALDRRARYAGVGLTDFVAKPIDMHALSEKLGQFATPGELALSAQSPGSQAELTEVGLATTADDAMSLVNFAKLHELAAVIGPQNVSSLLAMLMVQLENEPRLIEDLVKNGKLQEAAFVAHSLGGAAGNIGAVMIARIAGMIERDFTESNDVQPSQALIQLNSAAIATKAAISTWLSEWGQSTSLTKQ